METGAALRALHATVTAVEVAAHAEGEAVGLVGAEELVGRHAGQAGRAGTVGAVVVDLAGGLGQVGQGRQAGRAARGADQPLHLAAALEGVAGQQELWLV